MQFAAIKISFFFAIFSVTWAAPKTPDPLKDPLICATLLKGVIPTDPTSMLRLVTVLGMQGSAFGKLGTPLLEENIKKWIELGRIRIPGTQDNTKLVTAGEDHFNFIVSKMKDSDVYPVLDEWVSYFDVPTRDQILIHIAKAKVEAGRVEGIRNYRQDLENFSKLIQQAPEGEITPLQEALEHLNFDFHLLSFSEGSREHQLGQSVRNVIHLIKKKILLKQNKENGTFLKDFFYGLSNHLKALPPNDPTRIAVFAEFKRVLVACALFKYHALDHARVDAPLASRINVKAMMSHLVGIPMFAASTWIAINVSDIEINNVNIGLLLAPIYLIALNLFSGITAYAAYGPSSELHSFFERYPFQTGLNPISSNLPLGEYDDFRRRFYNRVYDHDVGGIRRIDHNLQTNELWNGTVTESDRVLRYLLKLVEKIRSRDR